MANRAGADYTHIRLGQNGHIRYLFSNHHSLVLNRYLAGFTRHNDAELAKLYNGTTYFGDGAKVSAVVTGDVCSRQV